MKTAWKCFGLGMILAMLVVCVKEHDTLAFSGWLVAAGFALSEILESW